MVSPPSRHRVAPATPENPRNDSASLVVRSDGSWLICNIEFLGGEQKGNDEGVSRIAARVSRDEGRSWNEHRVLVERPPEAINVYNPSFLRKRDGELLLFYHTYENLVWGEPILSSGFLLRSTDEGETFSEPQRLWKSEQYSSCHNTLLELFSGRLVKPLSLVPVWGGEGANHKATCLLSDDGGATWRTSKSVLELPLRGLMEGHPVQVASGRLLMAFRTQLGSIFISESEDEGETWSKPQTSGLRAPESHPVLSVLPGTGDLLMVWNHSLYDPGYDHFGKRNPLSCAISRDAGSSWGPVIDLVTGEDMEFSNPGVHFAPDGRILISFFSSKMASVEPPGRLGRSAMSLELLIVDPDWLYRNG